MQKKIKCFILGTGSLIIKATEILLENGHEILGILTRDKDIFEFGEENKIDIFEYTNYEDIKTYLKSKEFDYLFSIVNNIFINNDIINMAKEGVINFHDSPLPKYAGANATSWAIMSSENEHAITWHKVDNDYDSGSIYEQIKFPISENETVFSLNAKCFQNAIEGFQNLLEKIENNKLIEIKQDLNCRTYISRSKTQDLQNNYIWSIGLISDKMNAQEIQNLIRALEYKTYDNQLGKVKIILNKKIYFIQKVELLSTSSAKENGVIISLNDNSIQVSTASEDISITKVEDSDRNNISIKKLIELESLTKEQKLFIEESSLPEVRSLDILISKNENYWINEIKKFSKPEFPYFSNIISSSNKCKAIKVDSSIINELAEQEDSRKMINSILLAYIILIAKLSKVTDISIGYKAEDLSRLSELQKSVFSSYCPLNFSFDANHSIKDISEKLQSKIREVQKRRTFSKDLCQRYGELKGISPYFNITFSEEDIETVGKDLCQYIMQPLRDEFIELELADSMLDLKIILNKNDVNCVLVFSEMIQDFYKRSIKEQFEQILDYISKNTNIIFKEIELISKEQTKVMIYDWNKTSVPYEQKLGYTYLIEDIVRTYPNSIAVEMYDYKITYQELNERANQLARYLVQNNIKKGDFVGILFNKNIDMIVSVIAVLKAGAVYIPIDKKYPIDRVKYIINDSNLKVVITNTKLTSEYDGICGACIVINDVVEDIRIQSKENLNLDIVAEDLAYIIYTSGSTGRPKGVLVSHRGLNNLKIAQNKLFNLNETDKVLQFSSFSFDASIWEMSLALNAGATIVLGNEDDVLPGEGLVKFINNFQITLVSMPPSVLAMIDENSKMDSLHTIIVGSESCWFELINKWRNKVRFFNGYGPTEATVCVSFREYFGEEKIVTIGTPIANTELYILDDNMNPVPVGVPGEIYIGGAGIAKGYLNKPELTEQKFVKDIFTGKGTLYKSGDVARFKEDGDIQFIGRSDNQVKIRGFRIELEEIENVTLENKEIQKAVCILKEERDKEVILFYTLNKSNSINSKELRIFIEKKLPNYMIPSYLIELDKFPQMPNGKVNKHKLLEIDVFKNDSSKKLVPRNNMEEILFLLWTQALSRTNINITDDFFEIGGHSLLAIKIITNLNKGQGLNIPISTMFEHSTIQDLAKYIEESNKGEFHPLIKLQSTGEKKPIFAVHPGDGNVFCYTDLVQELGRDQPFYGFQAYGVEKGTVAKQTFVEMAEIYIKEMKNIQKEGPYIIFGYCAGGTIAYEMVRQLLEKGEKVEKLILLDARAPHTYAPMDEVQNFLAFAKNFEGISDADLFKGYSEKMNIPYTNEAIYDCLKDQSLEERFQVLWICSQELSILPEEVDVNYLKRLFNVWLGLSDIMRYKINPINCDITLFRAKDDKINMEMGIKHMGWNLAKKDLSIYEVSGNHFTLLKYPNIIGLAKIIKSLL